MSPSLRTSRAFSAALYRIPSALLLLRAPVAACSTQQAAQAVGTRWSGIGSQRINSFSDNLKPGPPANGSSSHADIHVRGRACPRSTTTSRNTSNTPTLPKHVQFQFKFKYQYQQKRAFTGTANSSSEGQGSQGTVLTALGFLAVVGGASFYYYSRWRPRHAEEHQVPDDRPKNLPRFRLSEVRQHGASSDRPWVTHEDKVYDITDWIGAHPGGDVILRAAGGSIEPYWKIFSIHQTSYAKEVLAQFLIGYVHAADLGPNGKPASADIQDPFADDPARDPRLQTLAAKPRSAETPQDDLADHFLTPTRTFYVRNHMWVPPVDEPDKHSLTVQLPDGEEKTYTLPELKAKFKTHRITAALQCAGNRRSHMSELAGPTNGLQWGIGAISNAEWEGVKLADVLADAAGAPSQPPSGPWNQSTLFGTAEHVWFSGLEAYGASIPLSTAFDPQCDVLLAFGMNGEPLPPDHGSPLRALVPGHVAARSVKFLNRITVADEESPTQWQRRDYKCFGPNQTKDLDWDSAPAIQEMPVTSAITRVTIDSATPWSVKGQSGGTMVKMVNRAPASEPTTPSSSSSIASGPSPPKPSPHSPSEILTLRGYAYSGGGKEIIRVDVSLDGGKTWQQASLLDNCRRLAAAARAADSTHEPSCKGSKTWAWKRWECTTRLPQQGNPGGGGGGGEGGRCMTLIVKATDENYNTQPQDQASVFNPRGNLATAWQRLTLCSAGEAAAAAAGSE